jgi:hypothetical protein
MARLKQPLLPKKKNKNIGNTKKRTQTEDADDRRRRRRRGGSRAEKEASESRELRRSARLRSLKRFRENPQGALGRVGRARQSEAAVESESESESESEPEAAGGQTPAGRRDGRATEDRRRGSGRRRRRTEAGDHCREGDTLATLRDQAREMGLKRYWSLNKAELCALVYGENDGEDAEGARSPHFDDNAPRCNTRELRSAKKRDLLDRVREAGFRNASKARRDLLCAMLAGTLDEEEREMHEPRHRWDEHDAGLASMNRAELRRELERISGVRVSEKTRKEELLRLIERAEEGESVQRYSRRYHRPDCVGERAGRTIPQLRAIAKREGFVDYSRKDKAYLCRMLDGRLTSADLRAARKRAGRCPPHEGLERLRARAADWGLDVEYDIETLSKAELCALLDDERKAKGLATWQASQEEQLSPHY